jgi:hypothetical protein
VTGTAEPVVAFYDHRGTAEQHIKEARTRSPGRGCRATLSALDTFKSERLEECVGMNEGSVRSRMTGTDGSAAAVRGTGQKPD